MDDGGGARRLRGDAVTLAHGAGGRAMRDLIDEIFLKAFGETRVSGLEDQARLALDAFGGGTLAFTTDSFVIDPIFFPGGDIGKLAVCGTVNDLVVGGAKPVALTCSVIIEEGLAFADLHRIAESMATAAAEAGCRIVTGDTKVVPRGAADRIFVNTAGIGAIPADRSLAARHIRPGDALIVNTTLGEHGAAVMAARGDLGLTSALQSDCRPLGELVEALLEAAPDTRAIRDATRGGVATVLNEFAAASGTCCRIAEDKLPLREEVRGISEILGLDPLYIACEGLFVAAVPQAQTEAALAALRKRSGGEAACQIGEVVATPQGRAVMTSFFGGDRLVDMLEGEQLPRIC
ncbi:MULTISPECIES: hydrogenase expression/formation protein HypE [Marinovum]|uniref:Hydrogenase maturation protein, carbamoyl dehydratase HypE n=2 Tax=Marinovum algicola TaxID=42444 RepID=A0A975WCH6_9RHOB|nr:MULTISPECIES: hydrogenase expression/formation protein HypE [Marinovum]MDD9746183.1 hydrogenase expression/formation protein HypE [Marinovum sp. PR37]SEJ90940.1 Hydrogenase maturation protein, carbamoyl dehydratase HypE [Marinovum algicola]SLN42311.1 Hydrogenase isoenzymes formation protein HypE [Marinovum algicola]